MRISDLIEVLTNIQSMHGDIQVARRSDEFGHASEIDQVLLTQHNNKSRTNLKYSDDSPDLEDNFVVID